MTNLLSWLMFVCLFVKRIAKYQNTQARNGEKFFLFRSEKKAN